MADRRATLTEGDEPPDAANDNSLGRLLALSDGVFAIAMTLLALDLRLPGLGGDATDHALRHALGDEWRSYLAFLISFYVIANYWAAHRRALRKVTTFDGRMTAHTLRVLLLVAALPFPASVLAEHGDLPSALALYAVFNLALSVSMVVLLSAVHDSARGMAEATRDETERLVADMVVFALCIPGAYLLEGDGPWLLLLLAVSGRFAMFRRTRRARAAARG
jgi:uncharacterized membrane protein